MGRARIRSTPVRRTPRLGRSAKAQAVLDQIADKGPIAAPHTVRVASRPITPPKKAPLQLIRVDLSTVSRHNRRPSNPQW